MATKKPPATVRVDELFEVTNGNGLVLTNMKRADWPEGVNFVARLSRNNGVSARVVAPEGERVWDAGSLSVALSGSVLSTFVQPDPFVTAFHVAVLVPLEPMTLAEKIWRGCCIEANRYRYNYGRQANRTLGELPVPLVVPDWVSNVPESAVADLWKGIQKIGASFAAPAIGRDDKVKIDADPEDAIRALLRTPRARKAKGPRSADT